MIAAKEDVRGKRYWAGYMATADSGCVDKERRWCQEVRHAKPVSAEKRRATNGKPPELVRVTNEIRVQLIDSYEMVLRHSNCPLVSCAKLHCIGNSTLTAYDISE